MTNCTDCNKILDSDYVCCADCDEVICYGCAYCTDNYAECGFCGKSCGKDQDQLRDMFFCFGSCMDNYLQEEEEKETELQDLYRAIEELNLDAGQEAIILENYRTGGTASRNLAHYMIECPEDVEGLLEAMNVAHSRHTETDYDSISKKGLTEEQVSELRRQYN